MIYKWKPATCIKTPASIAGAVFEELAETVGLTPKNLVDASREESAPLHKEFEWDDSIAAEKYRENQAGHMIRSITIETQSAEPDSKSIEIRAFFPVGAEEYEHITVISSDDEKKANLLQQALRELSWFKKKYECLCELHQLIEAIDILLEAE